MSDADAPTCETGFWKPMHEGCPVCGPHGPCRDPEYEKLIQDVCEEDRFKRALFVVSATVLVAWIVWSLVA